MLSYQVFTENLGGSWTDLQGKITKSIDDKMKLPKKILHNIHIKLYKYNQKKRLTQNKRCEYCGNKYKTTIHHCKYCTDSCRIKAEQDNNKKKSATIQEKTSQATTWYKQHITHTTKRQDSGRKNNPERKTKNT